MITTLDQCTSRTFDLCIIGAGPIGITLALEYAKLNPTHQIILLEFGHRDLSSRNVLDDSINILDPAHHHEPYDCTNKGLGGTSATWGGRCVMYDPIDFVDRPILNGECTWDPGFLDSCSPYRSRATEYFECGEGEFDLEKSNELPPIADRFKSEHVSDTILERWSMPTRFGKRYQRGLDESPNISVVCGVLAKKFSGLSNGSCVDRLEVQDQVTGADALVLAKSFVISAGAMESTRILLKSPEIFRNLGKAPKSLGCYYQGHLSGKIGSVVFNGDPRHTDYGLRRGENGAYYRRRFQLRTSTLQGENLLNTALWLDNPLYHEPGHRNGVLSMFYLAMITPIIGPRLAPRAIANSVTKGKVVHLDKHLFNVIRDFPKSILVPLGIFYQRYLVQRKLPQIFLYNPLNKYAIHFHSEQQPREENQIRLTADGEGLDVSYGVSDADVESVIKTHQILDRELRESQCGYIEYWYDDQDLPSQIREMARDGIHQNGTTRIADSPERGVVDQQLLVWGTDNLYICSSSALPTSSQANPTFFTGVLAVRLAHHLTNKSGN